jgi:AcrR family transcriptional regulator
MSPVTTSDRARTFTETARRAQIVEAAIDTIAEVGYARASLARIGERIGISKGLIGYHFAGKGELIKQVTYEIVEQMKAYMTLPILAEAKNGPRFLRAYIGSYLAFMREHRNHMVALVEISRGSPDGQQPIGGVDEDVRIFEQHLARFQAEGQLRPDFDPSVMALAIRAALNAVLLRLVHNPDLDLDNHARELVDLFRRATSLDAQA